MEPNDDVAIVEFDALLAAVGRSRDLNCAIADLLKYEWLPAEGRDFTVQYDVSTANGASLESEVFYPA